MSKKKLNTNGTLLNLLLLGGAAVILKKRTGSLRGVGRIGATKRYYYQLLDDNYDEYNLYLPDGIDRRTAKKMAKEFMKKNDIKEAQLCINSMTTDEIVDFVILKYN